MNCCFQLFVVMTLAANSLSLGKSFGFSQCQPISRQTL